MRRYYLNFVLIFENIRCAAIISDRAMSITAGVTLSNFLKVVETKPYSYFLQNISQNFLIFRKKFCNIILRVIVEEILKIFPFFWLGGVTDTQNRSLG